MTNPFTSPPFPPPGDQYDPERLTNIILALGAVQHTLVYLQNHFDGTNPLAFLAPEAADAGRPARTAGGGCPRVL